MNNKQLALLLEQYHNQLVDIFNRLQEDLTNVEGLEYHKKRGKWIGVGERPTDFWERLGEAWIDTNWEWVDKTDSPLCLVALSNFIDSLSKDIDNLDE